MRQDRTFQELRDISFETNVNLHAEGSCLVKFGNTHVLCTASIDEKIPPWIKNSGKGWVTAEYGMLPRSTDSRMRREAAQHKQGGRTMEIQRLIGRSLRTTIDMNLLGENTIVVDCDVIQADGGTRTASITGGYVALNDAVNKAISDGLITDNPIKGMIASVSVGINDGKALLDLNYIEDSTADTDMNVVMDDKNNFIEVQGTSEKRPFTYEELESMLGLAKKGITELFKYQNDALRK